MLPLCLSYDRHKTLTICILSDRLYSSFYSLVSNSNKTRYNVFTHKKTRDPQQVSEIHYNQLLIVKLIDPSSTILHSQVP